MSKGPKFTMNDLLSSLSAQLGTADDQSMTTKEMASALNVSQKVIYRLLDDLGEKVVPTRKQIKNRINILQTVPAYRLATEEELDESTN